MLRQSQASLWYTLVQLMDQFVVMLKFQIALTHKQQRITTLNQMFLFQSSPSIINPFRIHQNALDAQCHAVYALMLLS